MKGWFKIFRQSGEIDYDTSRDSIDKNDLSFEESPKHNYSNAEVKNINLL